MRFRISHIASAAFQPLLKRKGSAILLLLVVLYMLYAYIVPPSAAVIPQDILQRYQAIGVEPENMGRGFGAALSSPLFTALIALICMIMIVSIVRRGRRIYKAARDAKHTAASAVVLNDPFCEGALRRLRIRHYSCQIVEDAGGISLSAERGRWGGIGSILFHVGLLGVIAGIAYSTLSPGTESILLTEGESCELTFGGGNASVPGHPDNPRSDESLSVVRLVDFDSLSRFDDLMEPAALLEVRSGAKQQTSSLHTNSSLTVDGRKIHLGASHGYSPFVEITDPDGRILCSAFIRVASLKDGSHSDFIDINHGRMRVFLTVHPPSVSGAESPLLEFRYHTGSGEEGQAVLALGETKETQGITVTFADLREWAQFDIAESTAPGIIAFGAILSLLGLAFRLLFLKKSIYLQWEYRNPHSLRVHGNAEYFPQLFSRELGDIRSELLSEMAEISRCPISSLPSEESGNAHE